MKTTLEVINQMSALEADTTFNINISKENELYLDIYNNGYIMRNQMVVVQKVDYFNVLNPTKAENLENELFRFFLLLIGHEDNKYTNLLTKDIYGFWVSNGSIYFSEDYDVSWVGLKKDGLGVITSKIKSENFVLVKQNDNGYKIRTYSKTVWFDLKEKVFKKPNMKVGL